MKFGLFLEEMRRGLGQAAAFDEAFRIVDAAEAWGLEGVWLGEIHFNPTRSVMASPLVMAAAIAGRTRRLRIGTGVHILPLNHPLRIAEDVATLDHVSQGRLELGVGRSGGVRSYNVFGVPYAESQERFREALQIMREAWKGQPFSYDGTFHQVRDAVVAPRPFQDPHPPLRMAATSADTFPVVARLGLALFVGLRGMDIPELRQNVQAYRQAWRAAGHAGSGSVYLRIPVYAGTTHAAALEEPCESITYYFARQAEMTLAPAGLEGTGTIEHRRARATQLSGLSYQEILDKRVAFGSASALIERLRHLEEELGLDGVVAELNSGGLIPKELEMRSLRIIADEVLPAIS